MSWERNARATLAGLAELLHVDGGDLAIRHVGSIYGDSCGAFILEMMGPPLSRRTCEISIEEFTPHLLRAVCTFVQPGGAIGTDEAHFDLADPSCFDDLNRFLAGHGLGVPDTTGPDRTGEPS